MTSVLVIVTIFHLNFGWKGNIYGLFYLLLEQITLKNRKPAWIFVESIDISEYFTLKHFYAIPAE